MARYVIPAGAATIITPRIALAPTAAGSGRLDPLNILFLGPRMKEREPIAHQAPGVDRRPPDVPELERQANENHTG